MRERVRDRLRVVHLSARLLTGRRYWIAAFLPLVWPAFEAFRILVGWQPETYQPEEAQNILIGVPLSVLAIFLGVRVIAGEMDRRTLEIAYTVPGGAHRVWLGKMAAGVIILLAAEALLTAAALAFFTPVPMGALYGALQAAVFYFVLATGLAALFRSEITGAMAAVAILAFNGLLTGFGGNQSRLSPFYNPLAIEGVSPEDILAWTVQNRIGCVVAIAALTALAFARAERREKLLGG